MKGKEKLRACFGILENGNFRRQKIQLFMPQGITKPRRRPTNKLSFKSLMPKNTVSRVSMADLSSNQNKENQKNMTNFEPKKSLKPQKRAIDLRSFRNITLGYTKSRLEMLKSIRFPKKRD